MVDACQAGFMVGVIRDFPDMQAGLLCGGRSAHRFKDD
jgi:hypothetical protein